MSDYLLITVLYGFVMPYIHCTIVYTLYMFVVVFFLSIINIGTILLLWILLLPSFCTLCLCSCSISIYMLSYWGDIRRVECLQLTHVYLM